jgi:putative NADH-flavin reductase
MRVLVFGSTGGTGLATCRAFLAGGHRVTGFARNPTQLATVPGVVALVGDVMHADHVSAAMPDQDLVIISLGNSQNPFTLMLGARRSTPANVCETGTRHIIAAMQTAGVSRLLVVTAFGVGDTRENLPVAFKLFYRTVLREHMADKEKQEALVKTSGLDWTLVQPVGLTDQPASGTWLADPRGVIRKQQISRADVAAFLLSLAEAPRYVCTTVALSG